MGTRVRVPVGGSTEVGLCSRVVCASARARRPPGGGAAHTHGWTRVQRRACLEHVCACVHVSTLRHAQCRVSCRNTCPGVHMWMRKGSCVCVRARACARAYTHNTGACMALSMPRGSFWMAASVTAGGEGPGGECGCREVHVPHNGAGCPGRPGLGVLPAHSWSTFPLKLGGPLSLSVLLPRLRSSGF